MSKKKYVNTYYMFLLVVVFATFLGLFSSCYALTSEEVTNFLDSAKTDLQEIESTNFVENWFSKAYNYTSYFSSFDCISIGRANTYYYLTGFNLHDNTVIPYYNSAQFVMYNDSNTNYSYLQYGLGSSVWGNNSYNNQSHTNATLSISNLITNFTIYDSINGDTEYTGNNYINQNAVPQNTITLIAAKSGNKFTFHDKDQLQVYLTGDYIMADFTFYVQRYIHDEWQDFSDSNDYYYLIDFENPYYVFWNNLNYYPAGTYRYSALYGNNPEQSYYSNTFEIYSSVVDNSATGTVDSNGDIEINIDTGKTVDSIKDYLGEEPENPEKDIEDTFNGIKDNIEQELTNDEIIGSLQEAEQGFIDILREQSGDFKIEWQNVIYNGVTLIPAGSINFSKMCRDNQTLGQVKQYTNIIIDFLIAMAIIRYAYNLLLGTLGIDNQYLYEQQEDTSYIVDTGKGEATYYTKKGNKTTVTRMSTRGTNPTYNKSYKWKYYKGGGK